MLCFFKQIKKHTCRYHYFTSPHQKSWWYDLQFLRYRVWRTEIGNDGSFFALLPLPHKNHTKNEIWKNEKKLLEISLFYTNVPKTTIIWGMVPEIIYVRHIIFCHFGPCFTLLTLPPSPNNPENQNFEKLKKASRDHFTHVYQISQSYGLCFVRYGAPQREFFLIFDHFLTFYPT